MRATIQLSEPGTQVRREVDASPDFYPDTIAGLQRGDAWILRLGPATITAPAIDLLALATMIQARLLGPAQASEAPR